MMGPLAPSYQIVHSASPAASPAGALPVQGKGGPSFLSTQDRSDIPSGPAAKFVGKSTRPGAGRNT